MFPVSLERDGTVLYEAGFVTALNEFSVGLFRVNLDGSQELLLRTGGPAAVGGVGAVRTVASFVAPLRGEGTRDDGRNPIEVGFIDGTTGLYTYQALGEKCYPDCNIDGALNLADFGCFQTKFGLGDLYADCDGDNLLTLADFGCFQTEFALGCP
jgi:hypothetical protein